jgi:hypothetical protein
MHTHTHTNTHTHTPTDGWMALNLCKMILSAITCWKSIIEVEITLYNSKL